jgi:hypothetical protein
MAVSCYSPVRGEPVSAYVCDFDFQNRQKWLLNSIEMAADE